MAKKGIDNLTIYQLHDLRSELQKLESSLKAVSRYLDVEKTRLDVNTLLEEVEFKIDNLS